MMRWLFICLVAVIAAVISGGRSMPLEFALSQAGLPNTVVSWTSAQGTISKGRLNTVSLGPQLVGDVFLRQHSINPFKLAISYDVQWGSTGGRGAGIFTATNDRLIVRDLRLQQNTAAMPGLMTAVRELGGSIRFLNGSLDLSERGCNSATGIITTDVVARLGSQYGRSFSSLEGPVSCEDGLFNILLNSSSAEGDVIKVSGNIGLNGNGTFEVFVETTDSEIRLVLQEYGFTRSNEDVWHYRRQT